MVKINLLGQEVILWLGSYCSTYSPNFSEVQFYSEQGPEQAPMLFYRDHPFMPAIQNMKATKENEEILVSLSQHCCEKHHFT